MQADILNTLKNDLQKQCEAYDYVDATDNTLSDFIVNLVQVNKTATEINEELTNLVGADYNPNLTTWLFERKAELERPVQQSEPEPEQQKDHDMDVAPKVAKPDRENRIFSRALGSALGNQSKPDRPQPARRNSRSRSRSRSPTRHISRHESDRQTSRNSDCYTSKHEERYSSRSDDRYARRDDRSRREDDRSKSTNVLSRVGANATQQEDRPSVFDRLGGANPPSKNLHSTQDTSKQERCRFWPNCKAGDDCTYVHPTTICPDFPKCPKPAMECLYIHPEVSKPVMAPPAVKQLPVPCKFYPYCTNPMCPFIHPLPAHQPFYMQNKPSFGATGQRVQIPCKNGDACTRPDCHFLHPKDPNPQAEVVCKFDGACTRPNCFYKHTKPNTVTKSESMNSRQFSVAEDDVVEKIPVGESADTISHVDMDNDVVMDA